MENARLITETREALERQTATAEVLGVINSSPGDLAPVFDAILEKAMRLCGNDNGEIFRLQDGAYRLAVSRGLDPEYLAIEAEAEITPGTDTLVGRTAAAGRPVHILDAWEDPHYGPKGEARIGKSRTMLGVPLLRDGVTIGVICTARSVVEPFTDKQIELITTFAEQAVIAIENARLITETREALDQQTATAEVLGVINSSPGDLGPVFDAILEKAHDLCGVARGSLELYDGKSFYAVAARGLADSISEQLRRGYPASDNPATRPLIEGQPFSHILDKAEHDFPFTRSASDVVAGGTLLCVPLRRDDRLLGMIAAARGEVRPFTDKQIALLQNFAAQAVVAMENARLITETREALDRQTATAEVLGVINSSPGDLAPVFDAMLEKAMRLCEAAFGVLWTSDGETFSAAALRGVPPDYAEFVAGRSRRPEPDTALGRLVGGEDFVHVLDVAERHTSDETVRRLVELGGVRTLLAVPLRKDRAQLGAFVIYRQEMRPFTDKQIALFQNFAAQAVIAMENATADHRDARGLGAADRDRRGAGGHQFLAR